MHLQPILRFKAHFLSPEPLEAGVVDGCSFAAVIVSGRAGSRGLIPVCFVDLEGNGRAEQDKKPVALELCPQPPQVHG